MDPARLHKLLSTPLEDLSFWDLKELEGEFHRPRSEIPFGCENHYEPWPEEGTCIYHESGDPRARMFGTLRDTRLTEELLSEPDVSQE